MGSIPSVSLPAVLTCRKDCPCINKCYARKFERLRPNVRNAYKSNYDLLMRDPVTYWREVESAIMTTRFFRFHVSGDIPDREYLVHIIDLAARNSHCEILLFTKQYEIVNSVMNADDIVVPPNLHIVFSGWTGLDMPNPYGLPEAHIRFRDGSTTARSDAKQCPGGCTECAVTDGGCWSLKRGEQVVFNEH